MTYHNYMGIDIGKYNFVAHLKGSSSTNSFTNDKAGFRQFYKTYKASLGSTLVILETTGGHEMALIDFLLMKKVTLHRAQTNQVNFFARSLGKLAKTDAADAQTLAEYGEQRHQSLKLYQGQSLEEKTLLALSERIADLNKMLVQEKNRNQAPSLAFTKRSCQLIIKTLQKEIESLRARVQEIINKMPALEEKQNILMSIPGIGEKTSQDLLALMPELGSLSRRQVAALAGVAPHPRDSGTKQGYRRIRGGRSSVRRIIFMAAFSASHSNSHLGVFYKRLVQKGKKPMVALTALMRKIITIANAKLATETTM